MCRNLQHGFISVRKLKSKVTKDKEVTENTPIRPIDGPTTVNNEKANTYETVFMTEMEVDYDVFSKSETTEIGKNIQAYYGSKV